MFVWLYGIEATYSANFQTNKWKEAFVSLDVIVLKENYQKQLVEFWLNLRNTVETEQNRSLLGLRITSYRTSVEVLWICKRLLNDAIQWNTIIATN